MEQLAYGMLYLGLSLLPIGIITFLFLLKSEIGKRVGVGLITLGLILLVIVAMIAVGAFDNPGY